MKPSYRSTRTRPSSGSAKPGRRNPVRASEDQLLAMLRRSAVVGEVKGHSTYELSKALGLSEAVVRRRLKDLGREGKLGRSQRPSERIDGEPAWTPVYWIKDT